MSPDAHLTYRVRASKPETHLFDVELEIPRPGRQGLYLSLPAWIPGSYMVRDFARNIVSIQAADSHSQIRLEKLDKQTWRVQAADRPLTLSYQVYAWELSVRAAHLDTTHGYFNGPSLFLRVHGRERTPCRLELVPPPGADYAHWRVATSMRMLEARPWGFGTYIADDYEDLIDHPVEIGAFTTIGFRVQAVPHQLVLAGRFQTDATRLARDLTRICESQAALFGELPVDRYLFLTTVVGNGYGGLEHRFSTSLLCSRDQLPQRGVDAPTKEYRRFLGLCSHEYFHLWNVKRIRPLAFMEADLSTEVHTRLLWAFEGITAYYDDLTLVRSGCIDTTSYLELLAQSLTRVFRDPGRSIQTLAESSFDAWTKFYKQDENAPNAIVSYYAKGALVALALDLTIRRDTADRLSLDDLMRALWRRHGKPRVGVSERGIEDLAEEITGLDLSGFFDQALDSTRDLDLDGLLRGMGIELRMRPSQGVDDLGGAVDEAKVKPPRPYLGMRLAPGTPEPLIGVVLAGGPAQKAGLAPGDTLVAIDNIRIQRDGLDKLLQRLPPGAETEIHAFRRDELMRFRLRPVAPPADTCELRILNHAPEQTAQRRTDWLGATH